jgi:hypothetical protein
MSFGFRSGERYHRHVRSDKVFIDDGHRGSPGDLSLAADAAKVSGFDQRNEKAVKKYDE